MTKKLYTLTEEHRAMLPAWRDKWIANAMSTKPMDDADRAATIVAVEGLYRAANLEPPPRHRIVFVPSPVVLRFAGGFAAAIWWKQKNGRKAAATYAATDAATLDATDDATRDATHAATRAATRAATAAATDTATYAATYDAIFAATDAATLDATHAATRAATYAATDAATIAATLDATRAATRDATADATAAATFAATLDATDAATHAATYAAIFAATYAATRAATRDATDAATRNSHWFKINIGAMASLSVTFGIGKFGLDCASKAWRMWQGGNQWSPWESFLTFFRHVAKLPLDYSKYDHWESASLHSGPRIMHPDFCMISDRPEILLVDAQNRPHCETGPFCKWRDGTALYSIHGVRVPEWVVEQPETICVGDIDAEENAEVRRVMVERYGIGRYLKDSGATLLDEDKDIHNLPRKLWKRGNGENAIVACEVQNSSLEPDGSRRTYFLAVHPELRPILNDDGDLGSAQKLTCLNAVASTFGMTGKDYRTSVET